MVFANSAKPRFTVYPMRLFDELKSRMRANLIKMSARQGFSE
ncbi:hypothetical protein GP5015_1186 [gamma proteobacterium HTCC5015]|nr:hypothetical protein GP5015_1186 [gamma proteobacterium HTCC5015]